MPQHLNAPIRQQRRKAMPLLTDVTRRTAGRVMPAPTLRDR